MRLLLVACAVAFVGALLPLLSACSEPALAQSIGGVTASIGGGSVGGGSIGGGGDGEPPPIFDLNPAAGSGYSFLPDALGTTGATLALACDGEDAVPSTSWACRSDFGTVTFGNAENGSTPSLVQVPFTTATERAVDFNAGSDFFAGPSSSTLNLGTTEDFALEVVFVNAGALDSYFGKKADATAASAGWAAYCNASACDNFRVAVADGTNSVVVTSPTASGSGAWNHGICFFKRSDASGARCCMNGACGTALSTVTLGAGNLSNALTSAIGSWHSTNTTAEYSSPVAAVRFWTCTGCLVTGDYASIAMERMQRLVGMWPSAVGTKVATTLTRASGATLDIDRDENGTRKVFNVGYHWPRSAKRKETTGGSYLTGVIIEPSTTNVALQSETFANASWVENNIVAISEGSTDTPNGAVADTLESTDGAGSVAHFVRQTITVTAATYTFSVWVQNGGDGATHAWLRDNTVANAIGWVNLSTCAKGTVGAGLLALHAESYGGGWCRVGITFTGTAAAHDFDIGYSAADNATAYDDGTDSTADLIVWGAEVEAFPYMTSYQATTTASVTRSGDDYRFSGTDGNVTSIGTMAASVLCPQFDVANNSVLLHVGPDSNDRHDLRIQATNDRPGSYGARASVAQWDISGSTGDVADGEIHEVRATVATNDVELFHDGASVGTDTSATPSDLTSAYIGIGHSSGASQPPCLLARARIWNTEVRP